MQDIDTTHECLAHHIKIWTDEYACTGEVKAGGLSLSHEWFVITSQYEIEEIFKDPKAAEAISNRCFKVRLEKREH